jgi:predicted dehydrogenase
MKIGIVGGGIFGLTTAWILAKEGFKVDLYEEKKDVFMATSGINQFRLHRGYHYPRSVETIISCLHGERKFREVYPEVVIDDPHKHYYAIAKEESFLNANQCFKVWSECGLKYEITDLNILDKENIEKCVKVEESIIDPFKFKETCLKRCDEYGVNIILNKKVDYNDMKNYDLIVVATYAHNNSLIEKFPSAQRDYQFELVEKMVLNLPEKFKNMSVVIQDGPFTCIDPFGETGLFLMGNVTHAIHHKNIGRAPEIPEEYKEILNNGIIKNPKITKIKEFLDSAERFFPGIKEGAEHIGSMFTIRTVLPYREHDDARPTIVEEINEKIVSIFSGKIPTCVDAAEQVLQIAKNKMEKKKQIRVGIIGVGRWGKNLLRIFNEFSEVKACVNKTDFFTQRFIKENYPLIKTSFNYEDILNDDAINTVIIATPIATHFEIAKKSLEKGKKVFLEKPLAENLSDAEKLIDSAKGKILFVGQIFLYHPCYKRLKELTSNDRIVSLESNWDKFGTFDENIFSNLVSHELSIISGLIGSSPKEIKLEKNKAIISESDIISLKLNFYEGVNCEINIDRVSPKKMKEIKINTEKGEVYHWIDNKILYLDKDKKTFRTLFESDEEPLEIEVKKFLDHIKNDYEPITNKNIALSVMKMLDTIKDEIVPVSKLFLPSGS